LFFAVALAGQARAGDIDWTKVDAVLGGVHRYGISDLQVTLDGVVIRPALALGGWLGFAPAPDGAIVMGDLVLTESEDQPGRVASKLPPCTIT